MNTWIIQKYIGLLSTRLDKFQKKSSTLYNFRCPVCGDSETNKNRARGYIYQTKGKWAYHCHNCGASMSAVNLIKTVDLNLFNEMQLESIKENKTPEELKREEFFEKMKKPKFLKSGPLKGLKKVSQLSPDDSIKKYIIKRKIPNKYHAKLFACPNFMEFTNRFIPNKFNKDALKYDERRLLIPFFNENKDLHAYQGRSFRTGDRGVKYITIVLDETVPKIYGLDTVDKKETTYVLEGPIDSMFVENSIAVAGGQMVSALKGFNKDNLVLIYDNEPRSKETASKIEKAIYNGYKVCIWPKNLEHKDVNDMVMAGMTPEFIKHTIDHNTFSDLQAKLALANWRI